MSSRHKPITLGSPRSRTADTGAFRVTEAWFPPAAVLEPHTHDRSIFAIMLEGSFVTSIAGRALDCDPATVWTEPREERHTNHVGSLGARVLVSQPHPERRDLSEAFDDLLLNVSHVTDPYNACEARRVSGELATSDSLSPIVIDSLVVVMLARTSRLLRARRRERRAPPWLERTREIVHARFHTRIDLGDLADVANVTAWHLAREFRRYFHLSIGEYARSLRLAWALERLAHSEDPITDVAVAAGYADQSHLTRACKARTGLAPLAYRKRFGRP